MKKERGIQLTRREEQIMEVLYRLGEASVADIQDHLPESPTSGAVRRMLNVLLAKGAVEYRHEGAKKIYMSRVERKTAGEKALHHVVDTFFAGSAAGTMASLFNGANFKLSEEEKEMLKALIENAKKKGK
jgi:BlaI family penicillinase repressor